jgi:hypothetical protein
MINDDNEHSTDTVTSKLSTISLQDQNGSMSPTVSISNTTGEEQSVQNESNTDQNDNIIQKESQDNQLVVVQDGEEEQQEEGGGGEDDEFIRITAAHQMLTEGKTTKIFLISSKNLLLAQTYDEQKNYPAALHLYRICVDLLLEELMFTEGTDQSRVYLREKCTAIMDRVDLLKTKLEPIPVDPPLAILNEETTNPSDTTIATLDEQTTNPPETTLEKSNEQTTNAPIEELNSVHLS